MNFSNGFAIWTRTNVPRNWNVASYHNPLSLTWSWLLSFSLFARNDPRRLFVFHRWHSHWTLGLFWIFTIRWASQEPMYYRDLGAGA